MKNGYHRAMQAFGFTGWFYSPMLNGTASGIVVLLGAIMVYDQPSESSVRGVLILVFSIVSFFGMGGFFLRAILGAELVVSAMLAHIYLRPAFAQASKPWLLPGCVSLVILLLVAL